MNAMTKAFGRISPLNLQLNAVINKNYLAATKAKNSDKGWSATLSYKTYQQLKAQGIML